MTWAITWHMKCDVTWHMTCDVTWYMTCDMTWDVTSHVTNFILEIGQNVVAMACKIKWPYCWNVTWIPDMWHEYMTYDMNTWHVTWMHNMWHGYMTCDMDTWLVTEQLCWLKLSNYLGHLEIYLYIRNIWVARYFKMHDLCHDLRSDMTWVHKLHLQVKWHKLWVILTYNKQRVLKKGHFLVIVSCKMEWPDCWNVA